jgi:hypothetical protein
VDCIVISYLRTIVTFKESEWAKDRMIFVAGYCAEDELIFPNNFRSFIFTEDSARRSF